MSVQAYSQVYKVYASFNTFIFYYFNFFISQEEINDMAQTVDYDVICDSDTSAECEFIDMQFFYDPPSQITNSLYNNSNFYNPNLMVTCDDYKFSDIDLDSIFDTESPSSDISSKDYNSKVNVSTNSETIFYSKPNISPPFLMFMKGIPSKSRVETQIRMSLKFLEENGEISNRYKKIFIDENLIDYCALNKKRNKLTEEAMMIAKVYRHLILRCEIVKSSDTTQNLYRCERCTDRERKTLKKKLKDKSEMYIYNSMKALEKNNMLQFHTGLIVDIKDGVCELPLRITCYCRHHKESKGFIIKLTFIDGMTNEIILEAMSPSILMTDNRKTKKRKREEVCAYEDSFFKRTSIHSPSDTSKLACNNNNNIICSYIEKIIPSEGPMTGGTEVTVLGKNFNENQEFYFGDIKGEVVQFWNSEVVICKLPRSSSSGPIKVTTSNSSNNDGPIFTYMDDKTKLMETALQLIGIRYTGGIVDANKVAHDIINRNLPNYFVGRC